ncbi:MAG: YdeI/OmpD-associated family protein [Acidobacteriota bacterium]
MEDLQKTRFFKSPDQFRKWLQANHEKATELWVGFYKKDSGKPSITWPESVDQALCFGWIDGVRKSIDQSCYKIRFSPRKRRSTWSNVNIRRVGELKKLGLMLPKGLAAFEVRQENRSGIYAYEQRSPEMPEPYASILKANAAASWFYESQPPGYRKTMNWWVVSAKKEETRLNRLAMLIENCVKGINMRMLDPPKKKSR